MSAMAIMDRPTAAPPDPAEDPMPDVATPLVPTETIEVASRVVACDGGDGALGHPRVWLRIAADEVVCPYCSRVYVLAPGAGHDSGH